MPRNCNCCSSNSSWFVFLLDAGCQIANKSERKKSGKGMILAWTKFKQQINKIPSIFINSECIFNSLLRDFAQAKPRCMFAIIFRRLQERVTLSHMALTILHCPFSLTRLNRNLSCSTAEIVSDVYWCLPKDEKGDTNKIQLSLHF